MQYLITGATGNVGGRVAEQLVASGVRPKVLARDEAKARARFGDRVDVVRGDLGDAASLVSAMKGIDALFLLNSGPETEARDTSAAHTAKAAGVKRIVKLSTLGASSDSPIGIAQWHARGEDAVAATGVAWTIVRPGMFMSNCLGWAPTIRTEGVVVSATGDGKVAPIHPDDIAAVAVVALTKPGHDGQKYGLTGGERLSYADMAAKIGAVIGKTVTHRAVSADVMRDIMLKSGMPEPVAKSLSWYQAQIAKSDGLPTLVSPDVERLLGRAPLGFDAWARDNAAAFS